MNLARAVYRSADIYLLDDPLSAVDSNVSKHLFDRCIRGDLLRDSCVVLVTHQLQYAKSAGVICLLDSDGGVKAKGSPEEIVQREDCRDFLRFMSHETKEEKEEIIDGEKELPTESRKSEGCDEESAADETEVLIVNGQPSHPEGNEPKIKKEQTEGASTVSSKIYREYVRSGWGAWSVAFGAVLHVLTQVAYAFEQIVLAKWCNKPSHYHVEQNATNVSAVYNFTDFEYGVAYGTSFLIYVALCFAYPMQFYMLCTRASVRLHNGMFGKILRAPMRFFDINPVGRVLNRCCGGTSFSHGSCGT